MLLPPLVDSIDEAKEGLVYVGVRLGRCFEEVAGKLFGKGLTILKRYLSVLFEILLVPDEYDRDVQPIFLYSQDLISELGYRLEAGLCYDTVHNKETLSRFHILITEGPKFFLPGCVHDIQRTGSAVYFYLFHVTVFNGGVILGQEGALYEHYGKSGLADASSADHNNSVFIV